MRDGELARGEEETSTDSMTEARQTGDSMYVQIERNGTTMICECERVQIKPIVEDEEDSGMCWVLLEPNGPQFEVEKATTSVYILNNEGKTIQSYRWS